MVTSSRLLTGIPSGFGHLRSVATNHRTALPLIKKNILGSLDASRKSCSTIFSARPIEPSEIRGELQGLINDKFPMHPFAKGLTEGNGKRVMGSYLAMSEAFPYIQAGAYKDIILTAILNNQPITDDIEKTFVVGAFLSWDETGSAYLLRMKGIEGLPEILNTKDNFHSGLLKKDLKEIFKQEVPPNYCDITKEYLVKLGQKLGSKDKVERCAMMVAFEAHAGRMIETLWNSLANQFNLKKEALTYFDIHVGGSDPQEEYHIKMTQNMINFLVNPEDKSEFLKHFVECYSLNVEWCQNICSQPENLFSRSSHEVSKLEKDGHFIIKGN